MTTFKNQLNFCWPACFVLLLLLCTSAIEAGAQCAIQSNTTTCVDDLINFKATSAKTIASAAWDFDDNNTSNVLSPDHRFSAPGTYNVKVVVTHTDGTKCNTSKTITVYSPPSVDIQTAAASIFCFTGNRICLVDNSSTGAGTSMTQRRVLWGDGGKTDTPNPTKGSSVCYTYTRPGKYTITIELTNDKGCESKKEIDIEILDDFIPTYRFDLGVKACDSQSVSFFYDTAWSNNRSNEVKEATYDFGDGTKTVVSPFNTSTVKHAYKSSGTFKATLTLKFKNGCEVSYQRNIIINLEKVVIKHKKLDSLKCYPGYFEFSHPNVAGANYSWTAFDTGYNIVKNFGGARNAFYFPEKPGKYYIALVVNRGNCVTRMEFDSVESIGVKAAALVRNQTQCSPEDTVYFCNTSTTHGNVGVKYLWKFKDPFAPQCTTHTAKGQHVNNNCNFSRDIDAKHKYDSLFCDQVELHAVDTINGCIDSADFDINLYKAKREDFSFQVRKPCWFKSVRFETKECLLAENLQITVDSACEPFIDWVNSHAYPKTCDTSGWVTFGVIYTAGSPRVYRSCDPEDYYIDSNRICRDTFWYHNAFRLWPAPSPLARTDYEGCLPTKLTGEFIVQPQENVDTIIHNWGDGSIDTTILHKDSIYLPDFEHYYRRSGKYDASVTLITDKGCDRTYYMKERKIGFFNDFTFPSPACPRTKIHFVDTVTYWNDTSQYWRPGNPDSKGEKVSFDFGAGEGFSLNGPLKEYTYTYQQPGFYDITMVSTDRNNCKDTLVKRIEIGRITAGIKDVSKKIVCDDIIQLFDSSQWFNQPGDSIKYHYWDFGDGKTPSYLKNPFHFYSTYGEFTITHVVQNTLGCIDTAYRTITVDGPQPHFDILSDTVGCVPHTVEFKNNSKQAEDYIWYFGDSSSGANTLSTKSDSNVRFTYTKPGIYYIYLFAGDSVVNPNNNNNIYYCSALFPDSTAVNPIVRRVVILPIPKADFDIEGNFCEGQTVRLVDKSDTIYDMYRWYFDSDSVISSSSPVEFTLSDTGEFTVRYKPTYEPEGPYQRECYEEAEKKYRVSVNRTDFSFYKDSLCPTYYFTATGEEGTTYFWDFGHPSSGPNNISFQQSASHHFAPDIGEFEVCLISTNAEGCIDTICDYVESSHNFSMFIPNIITPNGDGLNDYMEIDIQGEDLYDLKIYNRWGEKVYESKQDYAAGSGLNWDGINMYSGNPCPAGTYFYIFTFREACIAEAKKEKYHGTVTVVRD